MSKTINLLYTCDDNYLPLVSISLSSFVDNNTESIFKVFVATDKDEFTNNYKKLIDFHSNISFSFIDCKMYDTLFKEKNLDKWGSNSYYVYWRMIAPDIIDCDYLYYVDTDIICLNKINDPKLDGKICGLVLDSVHSLYNHRLKEDNTNLYNTGIMYIDIKKWKEKKCTLGCIDFIKKDKRKLLLADQDIISLSLKDDICTINPKYNYFSGYDYYGVDDSFDIYELDKKPFYSKEILKEAKNNIIFYHCLGGVFGRPWEKGNNNPINNKYKEYIIKSAWPNYSKKYYRNWTLKFELFAETILPRKAYIALHRFAIKQYIIKNIKER